MLNMEHHQPLNLSPMASPESSRDSESPFIRVCDTPDSRNSSPTQSPIPNNSIHPTFPTLIHPAMFFNPFFPLPPSNNPFLPQNFNGPQRPLPFSIDNILNPQFGHKSDQKPKLLTPPPSILTPPSSRMSTSSLSLPSPNEPKKWSSINNSPLGTNQIVIPKPFPINPLSIVTSKSSPPQSSVRSNVSPVSSLPSPKQSSQSSPSPSETSTSLHTDSDTPPGMVKGPNGKLIPAWVFCTRYSDRPSAGPRARKIKRQDPLSAADKRPRTAFSSQQLQRLKDEFNSQRYLTEERRKGLAEELGLQDNQIKIWFQNKRAKIKKSTGDKGELAKILATQGLYNHQTVVVDEP